LTANYEYGPFGEVIRITGSAGKANPIRFSSKYTDDESGLAYYGYRYYNPSTGRWPSKDPIEERGGLNLYVIVGNKPVNLVDFVGLSGLQDWFGPGWGVPGPNGRLIPPWAFTPPWGPWHVDFPDNGTPTATVDVYYVFSEGQMGGCTAATVDRYVEGYWGGWSLDQDTGGTWDAVNQTAHAELDAPKGIGIRWPFGIIGGIYDLPKSFAYRWKVRCTQGTPPPWLDSGATFAMLYRQINVSGHAEGSAYTYTTGW
jgi:RHS repeat-associated protein